MKGTKTILFFFLATNFILVSCSQEVSNTSSSSTSTVTNTSSTASVAKTDTLSSSGKVTVKNIAISSRCVGCGKCARIDSAHFKMNTSTHKAEATWTSGNDSALSRATECCPVSAISVTEA